MAKFDLTISASYVEDWSIYEGIRELIQNAKDAEQDGFAMSVSHAGNTLRIASQGVRLDRSVLLLGVTSKRDGDYRGHFGEGLKLGALALTRAGRKLKIVNDDESWTFQIGNSPVFGVPVLSVSTRALPAASGCFSVEVELSATEWQEMCHNFRFLRAPGPNEIRADATTILRDPEEVGRCYVKGIYVETKPGLLAGYDFSRASTDRDRRMVGRWDFSYYASEAWKNAFAFGAIDASAYLALLSNEDTDDSRDLPDRILPDPKVIEVRDEFLKRYGDKAIPVTSTSEASEAGHLGRIGIVVNHKVVDFFKVYQTTCPLMCLEALRSDRGTEIVRTYEPHELNFQEQFIYRYVLGLAESAASTNGFPPVAPRFRVVEFNDPEVLGLSHFRNEGDGNRSIAVARSQLDNVSACLSTLIHELAHDCSGDGDIRHRNAESALFTSIIIATSGINWASPAVAA